MNVGAAKGHLLGIGVDPPVAIGQRGLVIQTPEGMTQAEIRILYAWPDGGQLLPPRVKQVRRKGIFEPA